MKNIFKHGGLVRFGHFDANPSLTENGSIYYNNSVNLFKVYENGTWENLATRKYADSIAAGFDPKESVVAASSSSVALSGMAPLSVDGIALATDDRVLLKNQSNSALNGVYVYSTSGGSYTLTRSADFNDEVEVNGGEFIFVSGGNTWGTTAWVVTAAGTIGVDSITFSQVQGQAKSLNQAYAVGNVITTSSLSGDVVIEGSQKLSITATGGLDISMELAASGGLITTSSGQLSTLELSVGSSGLTVDSTGDLTHIRSVPYHFPQAQASFSNAALVNDSSGNLAWSRLTIDGLSDVALTGGSANVGELLRFNGMDWVNEAPVATSASNAIVKTNSSGFIDQSFLQYDINFGGEADLTGIKTLSAASGLLTIASDGNISSLRGVGYSFPLTQASSPNSVLVNNGSGTLVWSQNRLSSLSDLTVSTASSLDLLRYNGSNWVNEAAISSAGGAQKVLMTNASGYLDDSFLQYNIDFGNNILSGITDPSNPQDCSTKNYVDQKTSALTLHGVYKQDTDGSGAMITTDSLDGSLIIAGDQALVVSASQGIKLADNDPAKFVQMLYKDSVLLTGNTTAVIPDLCFSAGTHSGLNVSYRIQDASSNAVRVGFLLVATDGSDASVADSFTETSDVSVSWGASVVSGTVEVSCSTGFGNKIMKAKLELLPA